MTDEQRHVVSQPLEHPSSEVGYDGSSQEQSTGQNIDPFSSASENNRWKFLFEMQQSQMRELIRAIKKPSSEDFMLALPEFNPES